MRIVAYGEVLALGKKSGIVFPEEVIVRNVHDAIKCAEGLGYPVVLKVLSPEFVHKTDAKVVVLDVRSAHEVANAYGEVLANAHRAKKKFRFEGVLVQKFVRGDVHMIVGAKRDPTFGPVVLLGAGGIFTEVLKDSVVRVCPVSTSDVLSMIEELRIKKILEGFRGINVNKKALVSAVMHVSEMMMKRKDIQEIDINPLILTDDQAVAVDMRVVM